MLQHVSQHNGIVVLLVARRIQQRHYRFASYGLLQLRQRRGTLELGFVSTFKFGPGGLRVMVVVSIDSDFEFEIQTNSKLEMLRTLKSEQLVIITRAILFLLNI